MMGKLLGLADLEFHLLFDQVESQAMQGQSGGTTELSIVTQRTLGLVAYRGDDEASSPEGSPNVRSFILGPSWSAMFPLLAFPLLFGLE
jgi:hypothetical protein